MSFEFISKKRRTHRQFGIERFDFCAQLLLFFYLSFEHTFCLHQFLFKLLLKFVVLFNFFFDVLFLFLGGQTICKSGYLPPMLCPALE